MRKAFALTLAALFSALITATAALAGPCHSAVDKFCKDIKKGQEVMACLKSHESELSGDCKAHMGFFEIMPNCIADADQLCPDEKPSESDLMRCLRGRQSDLSSECMNELRKIR